MTKLTKNTFFFTFILCFQKLISVIYFWYYSNKLTPNLLGIFTFSLSFVSLFSILIDLGINTALIREISQNKQKGNELLNNVITLKLLSTIFTFLILSIITSLKSQIPSFYLYLAFLVIFLDSINLTFYSALRAHQIFLFEGIGLITFSALNFLIGVIVLFFTTNVFFLILAMVCANFINFLIAFLSVKTKLHYTLSLKFNFEIIKYILKLVPNFFLLGIFVRIFFNIEIVMLGYLTTSEIVGFFSIPHKILSSLQQILPAAFGATIYPAFSNLFKSSKQRLPYILEKAILYLGIISFPCMFGILAIRKELFQTLWPNYTNSINPLFIMSLALPFIFFTYPTGSLLNAIKKEKITMINRGLTVFFSLILNFLLIKLFGLLGASLSYLIANIFLFLLDLIGITIILRIKIYKIFRQLILPFCASFLMFLVLNLYKNFLISNLLILILLGILVYIISIYPIWKKFFFLQ